MRLTKIIATIGPATANAESIKKLLISGANAFRFNIKHNTPEWHQHYIDLAKQTALELGKSLTIIVDIPKPELATSIHGYDFVALSYLTSGNDVNSLRTLLSDSKISCRIIAKIENKSALLNLDEIINVTDAVMVARGDLAKDIPIEHLAFWQKQIIEKCRQKFTPVIVATQMLQSMVHNPSPSRAEATDVANAVYDGTDCLMLSEETAMGEYPIEAVEYMARIANFCDTQQSTKPLPLVSQTSAELLTQSVATMSLSRTVLFKAIIVFSKTGSTARKLSAHRLTLPIITVTNDREVLEYLNLSRSLIPHLTTLKSDQFQIEDSFFDQLTSYPFLETGDSILVLHGNSWLTSGSTNSVSVKTL